MVTKVNQTSSKTSMTQTQDLNHPHDMANRMRIGVEKV